MASKTVVLPEIGEVLLAKRRGAKYLRLSITAGGQIRVGMPNWTPYAAGIAFAQTRKAWIKQHLATFEAEVLRENSKIGKAHRLHFHPAKRNSLFSSKVTATTVDIYTDLPTSHPGVQKKAWLACEKALKKEAAILLPQRLKVLADKHNYLYKTVRVRKMTSRWGSCSSEKVITLSYFLIQLPWPMIDYVLLHELTHTRHLNHGADFWKALNHTLPHAKQMQKEIRTFRPRVQVD